MVQGVYGLEMFGARGLGVRVGVLGLGLAVWALRFGVWGYNREYGHFLR